MTYKDENRMQLEWKQRKWSPKCSSNVHYVAWKVEIKTQIQFKYMKNSPQITFKTERMWPLSAVKLIIIGLKKFIYLFIYYAFYVAFNTVQVISRRVVGRAEETSTYSSLGFCTVNCRPNGKQLPAFPLEAVLGTEPRPQKWEARVLPLCHRGPNLKSWE